MVQNYRELLVGIDSKVEIMSGQKIEAINFDNAATTPVFVSVMEKISEVSKFYGSIGRGFGQKSEYSTKIYEDCRKYILKFLNAPEDKYTAIFVNNTTEGINRLSNLLVENKNDIVLTTRMEHHSNDLPWRYRAMVEYIDVDKMGRLKINELEELLIKNEGRVKVVTITGASNVTGYLNDINKIARIVHKYGAKIVVDAAQLIAHRSINIIGTSREEEIDFLVFSAHKVYAPFGSGAIVGRRDFFNQTHTDMPGGGTVEAVLDYSELWLDTPEKNEGGSPNLFGVVALTEALKEIKRIGYSNIDVSEKLLQKRALDGLKEIASVKLYADNNNIEDRLGIVVFNVGDIYCAEIAGALAKLRAIAVRQGAFCAHPYVCRLLSLTEEEGTKYLKDKSLKMPGMIRISFGLYNTKEEVDVFLNTVELITNLM